MSEHVNFQKSISLMTPKPDPIPNLSNDAALYGFDGDAMPHEFMTSGTLFMGSPGAGKIHLAMSFLKQRGFEKDDAVVVVPTSTLVAKIEQEWGLKAMTIHQFLENDIDLK